MPQPADGQVYEATDGQWYRWPDPTPIDTGMAANTPGAPSGSFGGAVPPRPSARAGSAPVVSAPLTASPVGPWLGVAGGCLLVLGCFFSWIKLQSVFANISRSGTDFGGNTPILVGLGLAAGGVALALALGWVAPNWVERWVVVVLGALGLIYAFYDLSRVLERVAEINRDTDVALASVGGGMYVVLLGAVLTLVGGVVLAVREK